ncbi:MAG: sigma-70 family RNA polymerase sigma factor [Phycisphaerales bacterium]|jgi:RNA polymerase sigma-70 factor (ECF subfamily)
MAVLYNTQRAKRKMLENKQLIYKLRHGDKNALRRIYEKYKDAMYAVAYSLLNEPAAAEDVLHDVFVNFARIAPRFRLYGSLKNYLITCVLNRSRDMFRSKMYRIVEVERARSKPAEGTNPQQQAIETEHENILTQALTNVPQPQREVIILHLHGGLKFREIADIQDVSINTVQGRYRYGLEKLRSILSGQIQ